MAADDSHRRVPGHVSIAIAGADEKTVRALSAQLKRCHNVAGPIRVWRTPGVDGVRVRLAGPAPALLAEHLRATVLAAPNNRLGIRDRSIGLPCLRHHR